LIGFFVTLLNELVREAHCVDVRAEICKNSSVIKNINIFQDNCFVNGEWVSAEKRMEVINPFNREVAGTVPVLSQSQVLSAIDAAEKAFQKWKCLPLQERQAFLNRWNEGILAHKEELAAILVTEQGKPLAEALGEIEYAASYIKFYAEEDSRLHDEIIDAPSPGNMGKMVKEPVGVVGIITPWNFPVAMLARKIAPALACGCSCVIKPDEKTPFTALALMKLAEEAGVPKGVLNCITGEPIEIGFTLCDSKRIRQISFTGSSEVGKLIMQQSAGTLKKLSLELGGNAPFIVFQDADIELAAEGLMNAKFRNAGQTCICPNRILVHQDIEQAFCDVLLDRMVALTSGSGFDDVDLGPIVDEGAIDKIQGLVDASIEMGAELVMGGQRSGALHNFYEPTLIKQVSPEMPLWQTEIFGPVVSVMTFELDEEAITLANNSPAGLAAYIYTADETRKVHVPLSLEVGMVGVNTGSISSANIPFGGVKESGFGREGSKYGLDEYLQIKYICTNS